MHGHKESSTKFGHSTTDDAFVAIELDGIKFICICVIRYFLNDVLVC